MDKANQLKSTVKKAGQLANSTKPKVDKVSPFEVYLLDDKNKRTKRICGTQRNDYPEGYVCLNPAGDGTDHPGYGQCTYHDRQITNPNNTGLWENLNREAGLPANLMEYFQNAQIIEEQHLTSVDEDIKGMYALVSYVMQRRRDVENPEEGYLTKIEFPLDNKHQSIKIGSQIRCIVFSNKKDFSTILDISDAWLPMNRLWVGEYPFLLKPAFEELCFLRLRN